MINDPSRAGGSVDKRGPERKNPWKVTMLEPEEVKKLLTAGFPGAEIELVDLTGTKDHYQARIVSPAFSGKSLVEQHQLVYRALGAAMNGPIHALALNTFTPEAWQAKKPGAK
jgi:stress-induced morphogen